MTDTPRNIDLCICTFRRPHIIETLRSVSGLIVPHEYLLHVIVADNDDTPSAHDRVERAAKDFGLNCTYLHAPARNISIARNACLNAAKAELVAFIDDDELVSPHWLDEMISVLNDTGADAVMGPVNALYSAAAPNWMRSGNYHSTLPVIKDNRIVTGGSGNVLMRMDSQSIAGRRFRIDLGKTGGEDSEFFAGIHSAGGHIAFAANAIATEEVPPGRMTFRWLVQRRIRYGQTHGLLLLAAGTPRLKATLIAACKGLFSLGIALLNVINPDRMRYWFLRAALHIGVVTHLLGARTIEIYGDKRP